MGKRIVAFGEKATLLWCQDFLGLDVSDIHSVCEVGT